jgi:hypothetical protein
MKFLALLPVQVPLLLVQVPLLLELLLELPYPGRPYSLVLLASFLALFALLKFLNTSF